MTRNEVIDKWCAALRSGEYRQGVGQLKGIDTYCCLGVLGEAVCGLSIGANYPLVGYLTPKDWAACSLPESFTNELGQMRNTQLFLAEMNDREGKTFAEIADWIEEHLKEPT